MGEVPAVSKEMTIPLLSHLGWTLCLFSSWVSFRDMAHVLLYALLFYSQLLDFYLVSVGIVVCLVCRGCVKDPRTTLHYYFVCRFFYFRLIIKWDVTFMVSERLFLRSVDLDVCLAFSVSSNCSWLNSCIYRA